MATATIQYTGKCSDHWNTMQWLMPLYTIHEDVDYTKCTLTSNGHCHYTIYLEMRCTLICNGHSHNTIYFKMKWPFKYYLMATATIHYTWRCGVHCNVMSTATIQYTGRCSKHGNTVQWPLYTIHEDVVCNVILCYDHCCNTLYKKMKCVWKHYPMATATTPFTWRCSVHGNNTQWPLPTYPIHEDEV